MLNLYQHMKQDGGDGKAGETTGHDRYYEQRPRSSYKKKRRAASVCRRALSETKFSAESIASANKRNGFRLRSVSMEREESEEDVCEKTPLVVQKIDSITKMLFNKSIISSPGSSRSSPSNDQGPSATIGDISILSDAAAAVCMEYLSYTSRYELIGYLEHIGSRSDRHWFAVRDKSVRTERLLTMVPLGSQCPLEPDERSRELILELFRALHHPYIYPVLDVAFCSGHLLAVIPFNSSGSLKDLIYKSSWDEKWGNKYGSQGVGLPLWQVARIGRQLLEGLIFLQEKGFPPFEHLHTGNVILQNGVARITGLENTLVCANARCASSRSAECSPAAQGLGRVLHEMCCGREMRDREMSLDIQQYPQVEEIVEYIFAAEMPSLHELLLYDLFRKIDLREMKGSCLPNFNQRLSLSCTLLLGEVARRQGAAAGGGRSVAAPGPAPARLRFEGSSPVSARRTTMQTDG